ncbi:hypothetical protein JCM1841_000803 [Sporobolomyces salmonicolor]
MANQAASLQQQSYTHPPFVSSRLASSRSAASPHPSSSDAPSSPTTSSFYSSSTRGTASSLNSATTRPRLYKSQSSTRPSSARTGLVGPSSTSPSSASTSNPLRGAAHENLRLLRARRPRPSVGTARDLSAAAGAPDEPGGWSPRGDWEEFDDDEKEELEIEMIKARREWKWRQRLAEEQADEVRVDPDEEDDGMHEDEQEPPLDVLSEIDYALPSPHPSLPSLASSIHGSPSLDPLSLPSPFSEPDTLDSPMYASFEPSQEALQAFEQTLLASTCPACGTDGAICGDETGAKCSGCGWGIQADVLTPLEAAFARHGDHQQGHLPLFSYTVFTDTIVFCKACDEQFAA